MFKPGRNHYEHYSKKAKSFIYYDQYTVRVKTEVKLNHNKKYVVETIIHDTQITKNMYNLIVKYFNESKEPAIDCFKCFHYPVPAELEIVFKIHEMDFFNKVKTHHLTREITFDMFDELMEFCVEMMRGFK